jgi:hypothetical protein
MQHTHPGDNLVVMADKFESLPNREYRALEQGEEVPKGGFRLFPVLKPGIPEIPFSLRHTITGFWKRPFSLVVDGSPDMIRVPMGKHNKVDRRRLNIRRKQVPVQLSRARTEVPATGIDKDPVVSRINHERSVRADPFLRRELIPGNQLPEYLQGGIGKKKCHRWGKQRRAIREFPIGYGMTLELADIESEILLYHTFSKTYVSVID